MLKANKSSSGKSPGQTRTMKTEEESSVRSTVLRAKGLEFDLDSDNGDPLGITFANGRFHVVDIADDKVYAHPLPVD